jgi:CRISPR-associated endonuclease/helicase Cas3
VRPVTSDDIRTESEEGTQGDSLTFERKRWVTLPCHTASVVSEVQQLLARLSSPGLSEQHIRALLTAAEWHDVGKGHFAFQEMLLSQLSDQEKEERRSELWAKSDKRQIRNKCRPYFRHELAGALAFLANCDDGSLESDLTAYLIAAHHGKVRLAIRSLPKEKAPEGAERRYALGVWDGDALPEIEMEGGLRVRESRLDLSLMEVGGDGQGRSSWLQRSLQLRDQLGPFRLAFLEALVRIADWRASAREAEGGAR